MPLRLRGAQTRHENLFPMEELGTVQLKGLKRKIAVYRLAADETDESSA